MLKKKFIFENEEVDPDDLNDFQKILALNKGKLSTYEVDFETSDGKDFGNVVVESDGLHFYFDDIEDFLKFFFPSTYEEGSESEWDAQGYKSMLDGNYDWSNDYWDRVSEDWSENIIIDHFNSEHKNILYKILRIGAPSLLSKTKSFFENESSRNYKGSETELIRKFLDGFQKTVDRLEDIYVEAQVDATVESTKKGIKDTYCDPFYDIGIEKVSRWCFGEYVLPWGSAILLFARFGTENDKLLNLIFESTEKTVKRHLPAYYELGYNYWDDQKFTQTFDNGVTEILEDLLEELDEGETYSKKYLEIVNMVINLGGFETHIPTRDKKYEVKISDVDKETGKVSYTYNTIGSRWSFNTKKSKTDIDSLINFLNQQHLFDPLKENKTTSLKGDL